MRALLFNAAFYSWSFLCFVVCLPLLVAPRGWVRAANRVWIGGILLLLRWIVGLSHRVLGAEHIATLPVIYAIKHQSAWETLALSVLVPRGVFILKQELLKIPLFGWYLRKTGQIAIDRAAGANALRTMLAKASHARDDGHSLLIFPEGTRVPPGEHLPYQPGIAALYHKLGVPVVPVALNSGLFWARRMLCKRPGRITIQFLPPIPPGLDRRDFLRRLERTIEEASQALASTSRF
ncbi:MAG TPA: lysophospholipid acyltransferase family protein [Dongiaceae bacterium]|jgi:1-acyl-sn-glycerol-3-phosphate acyltransferase|nr:lysophospholipid acyltransferase family protein [Dongiaceae bacterium]